MIGIRHEEYVKNQNSLPFIIHTDIFRNASNFSKEKNWHNDLEIQLCTSGNGTVLLNGEAYSIAQNDIVIIEPDAIHYTGTSSALTYTCLIINPVFFSSMGIEIYNFQFEPLIKNRRIVDLLYLLVKTHSCKDGLKSARLNKILLEIVIEIIENHSAPKNNFYKPDKSFGTVKNVIKYIRKNYSKKITLDELAQSALTDKYALCRNFKKYTGQTVTQYINRYRCQMSVDFISQGLTVAEAAQKCGFENLSFFTKTFKKYMGALPSKYKHIT